MSTGRATQRKDLVRVHIRWMIRRDMPVAVGRVQMAWKRRDIRAEARRGEVERLNALMDERWQSFTEWAAPKVVAAFDWAVAQSARIAALTRRTREDRTVRSMRARTKPIDRDPIDRDPGDRDAEVIAFPNRRDDKEEGAS